MNSIYFKIKSPGSFSGPKKLHEVLKQNGYQVSISKIQKWLQNVYTYTLFKPKKYHFKRNRVVTTGIDHMWDVDLADVTNIRQHNDGYNFLLVAIDVFSRYLWISPIKTKNKNDVKEGFLRIFSSTSRRPSRLRTDKGKEFTNKLVSDFLKTENIKAFTTKNETKANYAERVIRTIKTLMYRYFLKNQKYRPRCRTPRGRQSSASTQTSAALPYLPHQQAVPTTAA